MRSSEDKTNPAAQTLKGSNPQSPSSSGCEMVRLLSGSEQPPRISDSNGFESELDASHPSMWSISYQQLMYVESLAKKKFGLHELLLQNHARRHYLPYPS